MLDNYNKIGSNTSAAALGIPTIIIIIIFTPGIFLVKRWLQKLNGNHAAKVEEEGVEDAADCVVCLTQVSPGENFQLLPHCKHGFHAHCIDSWLKCNPTCPLCRKKVVFPPNHHDGNGAFGYVFQRVRRWMERLMNAEIVPNSVFEFQFLLKF